MQFLSLIRSEVSIVEGMLLQTVEGLGESSVVASAGATWESLQAEKESVAREILSQGSFLFDADEGAHIEAAEECARDLEWRHLGSLEERLRHINDAQDRLIGGGYGLCVFCGDQISEQRLLADPAASMCLDCQRKTEGEMLCRTL